MIIIPTCLSIHLWIENTSYKRNAQEEPKGEGILAQLADRNNLFAFAEDTKLMPKEDDQEPIPYQLKYPDLYVEKSKKLDSQAEDKVVYLTFDDGPSQTTLDILDILDQYKIKATFFVVYLNDEISKGIYREIVKRGHTIGVHSASHIYREIYSSVDAYLDDFNKIFYHIYEITDVKPNLFRFPGGSINGYNEGNYEEIISEMLRRGFTYHDWNVSSEDAISGTTKNSIVNSVLSTTKKYNKAIVLMHDGANKKNTVEALPEVIEELKANGYGFDKLDATIKPYSFSYVN